MKDFQKIGGIAALYMGVMYVLGILGYKLVLDYGSVVDPVENVAFLAENQTFLYFLTLFVYVIFGPFLVVLALALYERLKDGSPAIMQVATALGLIWAGLVIAAGMVANIGTAAVVELAGSDPVQAATIWSAIEPVIDGIGGGNEIVGGLWTLLISWAALRQGVFSRVLNILGLVVGVAGLLSAIPVLAEIGGMIFGLGQLVWFAWLGIAMLRDSGGEEAEAGEARVPQQQAG